MLFKIISLTLISCLYLQNFAVPLNQLLYKNDKYTYVETSSNPHYKLIASIPDKNIKLFASTCQYPDLYDNFLLNINGKEKIYRWESTTSTTFSPKLILSDINNDKVEELIIILTSGTGSDVHIEEIHILDMNNFHEYLIADPLIIINENVSTKITKKENDVLIQVKLNDKEYNIKKDKSDAGLWFEDIAFGGMVHWKIIDNKLYTYLDAQVSPSGFIGTIIIRYKFYNNIFNLDNISFEVST